jgi:phosphoribosylanthranilate isomerase
VGLFVNAEPAQVRAVLERIPLGLLQFHGDESPDFCREFHRPYLKAFRMRPGLDLRAEARNFGDAAGILVDSFEPGQPGGTGQAFAWDELPAALDRPLILAGGLNPENVGEAIARVRPYAVDVSSGVESAPGVKDPDKIAAFVAAVAACGDR